jgi:hypothetical protein
MGRVPGSKTEPKEKGERSTSRRGLSSHIKITMSDMRATRRGKLGRRIGGARADAKGNGWGEEDETMDEGGKQQQPLPNSIEVVPLPRPES